MKIPKRERENKRSVMNHLIVMLFGLLLCAVAVQAQALQDQKPCAQLAKSVAERDKPAKAKELVKKQKTGLSTSRQATPQARAEKGGCIPCQPNRPSAGYVCCP